MRLAGCGCSGMGQNPDGIGAYHSTSNDPSYRLPLEAVGAEPEDGDTGSLFDSYWDEDAAMQALTPEGIEPGTLWGEAETEQALTPEGAAPSTFVDPTMFTDPVAWGAPATVLGIPVTGRNVAIAAAGVAGVAFLVWAWRRR